MKTKHKQDKHKPPLLQTTWRKIVGVETGAKKTHQKQTSTRKKHFYETYVQMLTCEYIYICVCIYCVYMYYVCVYWFGVGFRCIVHVRVGFACVACMFSNALYGFVQFCRWCCTGCYLFYVYVHSCVVVRYSVHVCFGSSCIRTCFFGFPT